MKVLFVFNNPLNALAGGVERVTVSVMRGLSEEGWECFYLQDTGSALLENGFPVDVKKFFEEHAIDVVVQQLAYDGVIARYLSQENLKIPYVRGIPFLFYLHLHNLSFLHLLVYLNSYIQ